MDNNVCEMIKIKLCVVNKPAAHCVCVKATKGTQETAEKSDSLASYSYSKAGLHTPRHLLPTC